MKFYLLLIAFSLFFCSTQQQKSDKNTIEKAQKSNENEILKIKYFYVEPEIPINIDKDELEIVEVTKNRFLIYEQIYNKGVLKNSIIVDIPFNADTLFLSIPKAYLNNAKAYPFLNFKNILTKELTMHLRTSAILALSALSLGACISQPN